MGGWGRERSDFKAEGAGRQPPVPPAKKLVLFCYFSASLYSKKIIQKNKKLHLHSYRRMAFFFCTTYSKMHHKISRYNKTIHSITPRTHCIVQPLHCAREPQHAQRLRPPPHSTALAPCNSLHRPKTIISSVLSKSTNNNDDNSLITIIPTT